MKLIAFASNKCLSRNLFLLVLLLSPVFSSAEQPDTLKKANPLSIEVKFNTPLRFNEPISMSVYGKVDCRAELTLHVLFDPQLKWLNPEECGAKDTIVDGKKRYYTFVLVKGVFDNKHTTNCSTTIKFKLPEEGEYSFDNILEGKNLDDTTLPRLHLMTFTYLFAHKDTVVKDFDLYSQGRLALDSIDFTRNYPDQKFNRDSLFWSRRHATGLPPFTVTENIDVIAYQLGWIHYLSEIKIPKIEIDSLYIARLDELNRGLFYGSKLKSDSLYRAKEKIVLINRERLFYEMPNLEKIESALTIDNSSNIIDGVLAYHVPEIRELAGVIKEDLTELYYFDQFIIHSKSFKVDARLKERRKMLEEQTASRYGFYQNYRSSYLEEKKAKKR